MAHDEKTLRRMKSLGLRAEDFEETFSRSSGPGGQHVNKVSTAATVLHLPTGFAATASDSRSQSANRLAAFDRLLAGFEERRTARKQERLAALSKVRRQKARRSRANKARLVEDKRRRGETKKLRKQIFQ